MKKIEFVNLKRQYGQIRKEINASIQNVLNNQFFILGEQLAKFEKEFSEYLDNKFTIGIASGTDALILSLRALGIGKGDEVITQSNSFIATSLAITEVGATPVYCDINRNTFQIDERKIEAKINKKTRLILPVHLYGAPCQIDKIVALAKKYNLYVVEDACQSHGSTLNSKKTGTFGDLATFSFYPGKNLGAYGDGGAITTNNRYLYEKLIKLRNYGQTKKYFHHALGINSRLDEMQAAVLRVKLKYLDVWNKKRNEIATIYRKNLKSVKSQEIINNGYSNYHVYAVEVKNRNKLITYLKEKNIQTIIHYPIPIHLQECYKYLGFKKGMLPFTEKMPSAYYLYQCTQNYRKTR